ncbi:MAG: phosphoenolpyruvate--protein phosphotransferase [Candidatus Zixiibacteriota bacterium]
MASALRQNIKFQCVPVSGGLAMGEVQIVRDPHLHVVRRGITANRVKTEIHRLETAINKTIAELESAKNRAEKALGEQGVKVFEAQVMIASDAEFHQAVIRHIESERVNAEYAYQETLADTLSSLQKATDPYLRQMVNDIRSVSERVLSILLGVGDGEQNGFKRPTILVGRMFSPGEVMAYVKRNVTGFITKEGGPTSHMGLIARSLGVPAVMGDFDFSSKFTTGETMIVDGNNGEVIYNPDSDTWRNYRRIRARKHAQPFAVLEDATEITAITRDEHEYGLAANLEIPGPIDDHLVRLGIGVGLYRTEFLYFNNQTFPDETEQVRIYSHIADKFAPLPVTLRTFDLGGDKYYEQGEGLGEDNPALGWRGIRVALDSTDQFRTQIRAMLRASVNKNIKILLPMVSDDSEVTDALHIIENIKEELRVSKTPFDEEVQVGVMIEVPSAAMQADYIAERVDFFSIGTNDLIQYTMAADRGNYRVAKYYNGHHPAVLKLIQMTVQAAQHNKIPVTVCGEMAGDRLMTPFFVGLGVDELSMNPTMLPRIAEWISRINYIHAKRFVSRLLRLTTTAKVTRALHEAYDYTKKQKRGSWMK